MFTFPWLVFKVLVLIEVTEIQSGRASVQNKAPCLFDASLVFASFNTVIY